MDTTLDKSLKFFGGNGLKGKFDTPYSGPQNTFWLIFWNL